MAENIKFNLDLFNSTQFSFFGKELKVPQHKINTRDIRKDFFNFKIDEEVIMNHQDFNKVLDTYNKFS